MSLNPDYVENELRYFAKLLAHAITAQTDLKPKFIKEAHKFCETNQKANPKLLSKIQKLLLFIYK